MSSAVHLSQDSIRNEQPPKTKYYINRRWIVIIGVCLLLFGLLLPFTARFYYTYGYHYFPFLRSSFSKTIELQAPPLSKTLNKEPRAQTLKPDSFNYASNDFQHTENQSTSNFNFDERQDVNLTGAASLITFQTNRATTKVTPTPSDYRRQLRSIFRKFKISGSVTDINGASLPNIKIILSNGSDHVDIAYTDAEGKYQFSKLPPGQYKVKASGIGYSSEILSLSLNNKGQSEPANFILKRITVVWSGRLGNACKFNAGPRAGQTQDYSQFPPLFLGSPCTDGMGSNGIVVWSGQSGQNPTPTVEPTAKPTPTVEPPAKPTPTELPRLTPTPEETPTATPTPPEKTPTVSPTPTISPTIVPTLSPTSNLNVNTSNTNTTGENKDKFDKVDINYPQRILQGKEQEIIFTLEHSDDFINPFSTIQPSNNANIPTNTITNIRTIGPTITNLCKDGCKVYAKPRLILIKGVVLSSETVAPEQEYNGSPLTWTWGIKTILEDGETALFKVELDFELRYEKEIKHLPNYWREPPSFPILVGLPTVIKVASPMSVGGGLLAILVGGIPRKRRKGEEAFINLTRGSLTETEIDEVHFTGYAPSKVHAGSDFLVQIFAHLAAQIEKLNELANQVDPMVIRPVAGQIRRQIKRGSQLSFQLVIKGLGVNEYSESYEWKGEIIPQRFIVSVPKDQDPSEKWCKLYVIENSVPVGSLVFKIEIVSADTYIPPTPPPAAIDTYKRFQKPFISYSSKDRWEVLMRVQMLEAEKKDYFLDVLSLRSGENWAEKIEEYINKCDVFYLFWSENAKRSNEVKKEILKAYERQGGSDAAAPDIIPIPLGKPPPVKPPEELKFLHFNDRLSALIFAAEVENKYMRLKYWLSSLLFWRND